MTAERGKIWVRRSIPVQGTKETKEFYDERWFPEEMKAADEGGEGAVFRLAVEEPCARVNVQMGMTMNLGDYESARFDAGITLPCEVGEVQDAYKLAWDAVEEELRRHVRDARTNRRGR